MPPPVICVVKTQDYPGYLAGRPQPSLIVWLALLRGGQLNSQALQAVDKVFARELLASRTQDLDGQSPMQWLGSRILDVSLLLLAKADMPIVGAGAVEIEDTDSTNTMRLLLPSPGLTQEATKLALSWVLGLANQALKQQSADGLLWELPELIDRALEIRGAQGRQHATLSTGGPRAGHPRPPRGRQHPSIRLGLQIPLAGQFIYRQDVQSGRQLGTRQIRKCPIFAPVRYSGSRTRACQGHRRGLETG